METYLKMETSSRGSVGTIHIQGLNSKGILLVEPLQEF